MTKHKPIPEIVDFDFYNRRKELKLSLRQVGRATGIAHQTVMRLEKEGVNPEYMHVKILNDFYNNYK